MIVKRVTEKKMDDEGQGNVLQKGKGNRSTRWRGACSFTSSCEGRLVCWMFSEAFLQVEMCQDLHNTDLPW